MCQSRFCNGSLLPSPTLGNHKHRRQRRQRRWLDSIAQGSLAVGGLAATRTPTGPSPVSITPHRLPLRPGPRGTGPRCWPGVWAEAPMPWFLFGGGTKVIVPGKWLSPLPQPVPPSALLGKSLLSVFRGQGLHQGRCHDDRPSLYHLQVGPSPHPRSLCSRPPRTSSAPTRAPWCVSSATSTRAT